MSATEYFELWRDGLKMEISRDAMPVGTDSVLLASFVSVRGLKTGLDLGSGSGLLALTLAIRDPQLSMTGVELSPAAAELSRRNAELNGLSERFRVICADMRTLRETDIGKRCEFIITNPPYFSESSGTVSPIAERAARRSETECSLKDMLESASRLLKFGGRFFMVYPAERLAELICALTSAQLEPKRLRLVQQYAASAPSVALIECRLGGKPGLKVEPVLIIKNPDGTDTEEVRKIYHLD